MLKQSLPIIVIFVVSASIALAFAIANIDQLQPKSDPGSVWRFDNETIFRSAAPFGHHLGILASYSGSEASIGVGNPSRYEFKSCSVFLDTTTGKNTNARHNATIRLYDRILPHSYDYFTAELLQRSTNGNSNWLILECKEPYELATASRIFIGRVDYVPGETVTIKGMVGFSGVTLRVLDADGKTNLEQKLPTNNGLFQFSFLIPSDAKPGTWSIQVGFLSETYGQDFRVLRE